MMTRSVRRGSAICFLILSILLHPPSVFGQESLEQLEKQLQAGADPFSQGTSETFVLPAPIAEETKVQPEAKPATKPTRRRTPSPPNAQLFPSRSVDAAPDAQPVAPLDVAEDGSLPAQPAGYLGMTAEKWGGGGLGLRVVELVREGPAWKAGFRIGDRILGVAGRSISDLDQFAKTLSEQPAGKPVRFLVRRAGRNIDLVAVPMDRQLADKLFAGTPEQLQADVRNDPAFLGLVIGELSREYRKQFGVGPFRGAAVLDVVKESPAALVGIKPGDCVVQAAGAPIESPEELTALLAARKPGDVLPISYVRGTTRYEAEVLLTNEAGAVPMSAAIIEESSPSTPAPTPDPASQQVDQLRRELDEAKLRMEQLERRLQQLNPGKRN
ncbi:MAG: PDZ domain-containing protein [Pirellulaceae bacterium]